MVNGRQFTEQDILHLGRFGWRQAGAVQPLPEEGLGLCPVGRRCRQVVQGMVGQAAAPLMEKDGSGAQGVCQIGDRADGLPGRIGQAGQLSDDLRVFRLQQAQEAIRRNAGRICRSPVLPANRP